VQQFPRRLRVAQERFSVFSVSPSQEDAVKRYIATQAEHHKKEDFQSEWVRLLRAHGIEFDERYVFDRSPEVPKQKRGHSSKQKRGHSSFSEAEKGTFIIFGTASKSRKGDIHHFRKQKRGHSSFSVLQAKAEKGTFIIFGTASKAEKGTFIIFGTGSGPNSPHSEPYATF